MKKLNSKTIGNLYAILILVVFTLAIPRGYINVTYPKLIIFYFAAGTLAIGAVVLILMRLCKKQEVGYAEKFSGKKWAVIAVFPLAAFITFLINGGKAAVAAGTVEYGVGLAFILVAAMVIICLSFCGFDKQLFARVAVDASMFTVIMTVFQTFGFDLFGLWASINEKYDNTIFVSTFGNRGLFGCYIAAIFPMAIYLYLYGKDVPIWEKILGIFSCAIGMVTANTEGTVLACLIILAIAFYLMGKNAKMLSNFFAMLTIMGAAWLMLGLCYYNLQGDFYFAKLDTMSLIWITPIFSIVIMAAGVLGVFILSHDMENDAIASFTKAIFWAFIIVICLIPIVIILYTKAHPVRPDSSLAGFLYFDYWWGSFRGYIWGRVPEMLKDNTLSQWIFGNGIGSFSDAFISRYETFVETNFSGHFDDAHNIFLMCLYEYGLVGLVAFCTPLFAALYSGFKKGDSFEKFAAAGLLGMLVAQSFLVVQNISLTYILLFTAVILTNTSMKKDLDGRN